jgi:GlpG protein
MRWIGSLPSLEQAQRLVRYLAKQGIESAAEKSPDEQCRVWVVKEDQVQAAQAILEAFQKHPDDPQFDTPEPVRPIESLEERASEAEPIRKRIPFRPLTLLIGVVCVVLLLVQQWQEVRFVREVPSAAQVGGVIVPLQQELMIEVPQGLIAVRDWLVQHPNPPEPPTREELLALRASRPEYSGLWGTFEQSLGVLPEQPTGPFLPEVRAGQIWRLWTPALLHGGMLHLVFNLLWWFYLARQLECRIGMVRFGLLIGGTAVAANLAQYLASGPDFLGLSGVICGLAGFILIRERKAPWEGYAVPRATLNALVGFVLLAAVAEGLLVLAQAAGHTLALPISFGNTAHIVGGLAGMGIALLPCMGKRSAL